VLPGQIIDTIELEKIKNAKRLENIETDINEFKKTI
jgi:hypothetical protein